MKKDEFEDQILNEFKALNLSLQLVNKQLSILTSRIVGVTSAIGGINQTAPIEIMKPEANGLGSKEYQENTLMNLQITALREELEEKNKALLERQKKKLPKYESNIPAIVVENTVIILSSDSNENKLCQVLFKDVKSMRKLWSWDEIIEKWSEDPENYSSKTIYMAGTRLNQKIAIATQIQKFFEVKTTTIRISPSLLK
ncbi:MAG TPA: hypothetical protein PLS49_00975 [Candidatus Woesebacteria bacterium]|nr:hypothetical protein [Candidatus Woesebacteria bacterium]